MGEYHTVKTGPGSKDYETMFKLGTMDDWRYVRRGEAETLSSMDAGENTNIPASVSDTSTLWRFPWPDEDQDMGAYVTGMDPDGKRFDDREMFRTVCLSVPIQFPALDHHDVCQHVSAKGGGYGFNVFFPCPQSKQFQTANLRTSPLPFNGKTIIHIIGERHNDNGPRTIFACSYCDAYFSVTDEQARIIQGTLLKMQAAEGNPQWYLLVADRIAVSRPRSQLVAV